ncbi:MAG: hypothetical protein QXN75_03705 [Thermoproteota archaeon]
MKDLENLATVTIVIVVYTIIFVASIIIGAAQGEILTVTNKPEQPPYKRSSHEFPVKIIDSKLVEYREEGPYIIETYAQVVEMGKPRLSDLIENSKDYFNFIESTYGESGRRMIKAKIKEWEEFLENLPDQLIYNVEVPIVKLSRVNNSHTTIQYSPALFSQPYNSWDYATDPVNLVFWERGSAWDVQYDIQYDMKNWIPHKWRNAWGSNLYANLDKNHADNSDWVWKTQDYQLEYDGFFTTRYHIRIFDGGSDWDYFGKWSICGVHHEYFAVLTHIIDSWDGAESFVVNDFRGLWFVGEIVYGYLPIVERKWQNVYNDGYVPIMRLIY